MVDLSCKYLELQLRNPVIAGSSGLTSSIVFFDIIHEVKKYVTIPVSLKTGYYFSSIE